MIDASSDKARGVKRMKIGIYYRKIWDVLKFMKREILQLYREAKEKKNKLASSKMRKLKS